MKPFFSNKGNLGHKTNWKKRVDTNDQEIANELHIFSKDTTSSLGINENP